MSEEISEVVDKVEEKVPSRVSKVISGVGGAYKFAWYTWLGTAVTAEEKLKSLGKGVASSSKKMAAKGRGVKITAPKTAIMKQLDAPKAKLTTMKADLTTKAQGRISHVEDALDKGVNKSLHFVGVPSRKDMDQMTSLMKDMADSITELSEKLQESKPPATRSSAKKSKSDGGQTSAA